MPDDFGYLEPEMRARLGTDASDLNALLDKASEQMEESGLLPDVRQGARGVFCRCCGDEIIYMSEGKLKGMGEFDCARCDAQIARASVCLSFWELLQLRILPTPRLGDGSPVAMGLSVVAPFGNFQPLDDPDLMRSTTGSSKPWWKRLRPGWKLLVEEWKARDRRR